MKLKLVVGSILLGLASSSSFAMANNTDTQTQLDSLKAQVAKMEAAMQQNQPGGFQQVDGWANRITVSGQANVDAAIANRSPVIFNNSGYVSDIYLNNANLYIDAQASDWTSAHIGLAYGSSANNFIRTRTGQNTIAVFNSSKPGDSVIDEAYVNIANFAKSPFYFKAGKQRVLFGDYVPYADITKSVTQLLSETHAVAGTVGFSDASGFNAAAYVFRGGNTRFNSSVANSGLARTQNFGLNLGFANGGDTAGYKFGAGYLRNMVDVDFVNSTAFVGTTAFSRLLTNNYTSSVGGLSLNAAGHYNAFDGSLKYVAALQSFDPADVAYTNNSGATTSSSKPKAWTVDAGYSFLTGGHQSRFALGYQGTSQAAMLGQADSTPTGAGYNGVGLPKTRYLANYTVNVSKYTDLGFELRNDRNYPNTHRLSSAFTLPNTQTGATATVGTVRLAVKFA